MTNERNYNYTVEWFADWCDKKLAYFIEQNEGNQALMADNLSRQPDNYYFANQVAQLADRIEALKDIRADIQRNILIHKIG